MSFLLFMFLIIFLSNVRANNYESSINSEFNSDYYLLQLVNILNGSNLNTNSSLNYTNNTTHTADENINFDIAIVDAHAKHSWASLWLQRAMQNKAYNLAIEWKSLSKCTRPYDKFSGESYWHWMATCQENSCLIKWNISFESWEKIYHLPGCWNYNDTVINENYWERRFCSETEAIAAGRRKAKNC